MFSASDVKELRERTGAGMLDCKKALEATNGNMQDAMDWLREKGISKVAKKESRIAAEGLSQILTDGNKAVIVEVNSETDFVAKNEEFKHFIDMVAKAVLENEVEDMDSALAIKVDGETIQEKLVALVAKIGEKISFRRFELVRKSDSEVFGPYIHMGGKIAVLVVLEGANEEVARDVAMHTAAMRPDYVVRSEVPEDVLAKEKNIIKEQAMNEGKPANIAEKMVEGRINKFYKEVCLTEQQFVKNSDITVLEYVNQNNGAIKKVIRYEVGEGIEKKQENFAEEVMSQIKK